MSDRRTPQARAPARRLRWLLGALLCSIYLCSPAPARAHALAPIVVRTLDSSAERLVLSVRFPTHEQALSGLSVTGCDTAELQAALQVAPVWSGTLRCAANQPRALHFPGGAPTGLLWEDARGARPVLELHGEQPPGFELPVPELAATTASLASYLGQGVAHVWSGWDHLAFVTCLVLLCGPLWLGSSVRRLFTVVTLFTVAHSVSLGLSVLLGGLGSPGLEAAIALSVVFAAREVAVRRARELEPDVNATRRLMACAVAFGLLHGLGFASALLELGLPAGQVPAALLLFNLGVELGQVAVVSGLVLAFCALPRRSVRPAALAVSYAAGALAVFWMVERVRGA